MCRTAFHPFLAALPKCEHHMHLEGSLSPTLLFSLAERNNITLPSATEDPSFASPATLLERYERFTSLDDFLQLYYIGMRVLLHEQDFESLAWEYFCRAKADGVAHAEVFFDPQAHTGRGIGYKTVLEGFVKACRRAEKELGMTTLLIMCFLRHLPAQEAQNIFNEAKEDLLNGTLAGVGLDSSEVGFPAELFKQVYQSATDAGIRRTAHAGEEGDADMIRGALQHLNIQRIDHGIRMAGDEALMTEVAEKGYLVTMCPLSNVRLQCVKKWASCRSGNSSKRESSFQSTAMTRPISEDTYWTTIALSKRLSPYPFKSGALSQRLPWRRVGVTRRERQRY